MQLIENHVGWIMDNRIDANRDMKEKSGQESVGDPSVNSFSTSLESLDSLSALPCQSASLSSTPQSLPAFEHPSHALLKENHFTQQAYYKYVSLIFVSFL